MESIKVWMGVCPLYGPSIHNVAEKYREHAPEELIQWVDDWLEADLVIDHLIGTPDRTNLVHPLERGFSEDVKARLEMAKVAATTPFEDAPPSFRVAYVMHCAIVDDDFYREAFDMAVISTGFLDAPSMCPSAFSDGAPQCNWLRVGWGVDPADFLLPTRGEEPPYLIYTWGASQDPEEEYIETIYKAVKRVGGKMLHSGLDYGFDSGEHYVFVPPAETKAEIAERYNKCWFANAMRQEDGFELANIEAPLSNCKPITLAKQPYAYFFNRSVPGTMSSVSAFVEEHNIEEGLVSWFNNKEKWKITSEDKRYIIERFNWRDTVEPFWKAVTESCSLSPL